jgi:hypothetical protein
MALSLRDSIPITITPHCSVCHNFKKRLLRFGNQIRFAADFAPKSLLSSALKCPYCAIVLGATQKIAVSATEALEREVAWIYIRGSATHPPRSLSLEIYFKDSRPKLELETYAQDLTGRHNLPPALFCH